MDWIWSQSKTQAGIKYQVRYESLASRVEGCHHRQGGKSKRDQALDDNPDDPPKAQQGRGRVFDLQALAMHEMH